MKIVFVFIMLVSAINVTANTLENRMASFALLENTQATFVETWIADYLDEPLVTRGKLSYRAPNQLEKIIESPELIEQRVIGDELSVTRDGDRQYQQLSNEPVLAAGINAMRNVLRGDQKQLEKNFTVSFREGDKNKEWVIGLIPRSQKVLKKIKDITLYGRRSYIQKIQIEYQNGDRLLTEIMHSE